MKLVGLLALPAALLLVGAARAARDPHVGESYKVPYRVTETNHFLVRVRIDGKGPFNFLVDTGAPALYISTETARKIGLAPEGDAFWTSVGRVDFEGGPTLSNMKARIEDPFQLVGMNALGLPGASIDGILGFSILSRFRLELDPTRDRMTWTRLDYEPADLPEPPPARKGEGRPSGVRAMEALGPLAKLAAAFVGKQPEEKLLPRGRLGIALAEEGGAVVASGLLADSPAARAGLRVGDRLASIAGKDLATLKDARAAVALVRPGDPVAVRVRRGVETLDLQIQAEPGL